MEHESRWMLILLALLLVALLVGRIASYVRRWRGSEAPPPSRGTSPLPETDEQRVYRVLRMFFPEEDIFQNVYLRHGNGYLTEIDFVVLSDRGIFVVESKHYSGAVYGGAQDEQWTHQRRNGETHEFHNPLLQNKGHIKALAFNLSQYRRIRYVSIVVFVDRCQLSPVDLTEPDTYLIQLSALHETLTGILSAPRSANMSDKTKAIVAALLTEAEHPSEETKRRHMEEYEQRLRSLK